MCIHTQLLGKRKKRKISFVKIKPDMQIWIQDRSLLPDHEEIHVALERKPLTFSKRPSVETRVLQSRKSRRFFFFHKA